MDGISRLVVYATVLGMISAVEAFASQTGEAAIHEVQTRQAAAWNAHERCIRALLTRRLPSRTSAGHWETAA